MNGYPASLRRTRPLGRGRIFVVKAAHGRGPEQPCSSTSCAPSFSKWALGPTSCPGLYSCMHEHATTTAQMRLITSNSPTPERPWLGDGSHNSKEKRKAFYSAILGALKPRNLSFAFACYSQICLLSRKTEVRGFYYVGIYGRPRGPRYWAWQCTSLASTVTAAS